MQDFTNIFKAISTLDGILEKHPGEPPHIGHEGSPGQDSHGRSLKYGEGSRASVISVLSAARDVGHEVPSRGELDAAADRTLWDTLRDLVGSEDKAVSTIKALPKRKHGEALRAGDVPQKLLDRFMGPPPRAVRTDGPINVFPQPVRQTRRPKNRRLSLAPSRAKNDQRIKDLGIKFTSRPTTRAGKKILGGKRDTKSLHVKDGKYTPERLAVHDDILRSFLELHRAQDNPRATLVAGGAGVDFKGAMQALSSDERVRWAGSVQIDPARIATMLPEYEQLVEAGDNYASQAVDEESRDLAYRLFQVASKKNLDVTLHGTGNDGSGEIDAVSNQLTSAGYRVRAILIQMDPEAAVERALETALGSSPAAGQMVPPDAVRASHIRAAESFTGLQRRSDLSSLTIIDTTGPTPIMVAEGAGGSLDVYDPDLFRSLAVRGGFNADEAASIPERARYEAPPRLSPGLPEPAALSRGEDVPREAGYVHFLGSTPQIQEIIFDGEIPLPEGDEESGDRARIMAADEPADLWDDAPRAASYSMLRFRDENVGRTANGDRFVERPVAADQIDVYTENGWESLTSIKDKDVERSRRFDRIR